MENKLAVVAFGGNALLRGDQKGTIEEQESNVYDTSTHLVQLIEKGYDIIIGHGNGPQVGNVLLQHEAGQKIYGIPMMPMDICVAETQGAIGLMIEQQLRNVLAKHGIKKNIVTMVSEVIVDKNDPAFKNPTKPVGPFYTKEEADSLTAENDWVFHEDPRGRGWRRVVASPVPVKVNNREIIERLAREGNIVITVGGGGVPAYVNDQGETVGIDAVIDKDLASAHLAGNIKADEFYILTDVPQVYINFNKPNQKALSEVKADEIQKYLHEGHFTEGSMAPKVRAGLHFIDKGGKACTITMADKLGNENAGTTIIRN
ncbi:MAG: carbamate kinase [Bacteroidales bacterium]